MNPERLYEFADELRSVHGTARVCLHRGRRLLGEAGRGGRAGRGQRALDDRPERLALHKRHL